MKQICNTTFIIFSTIILLLTYLPLSKTFAQETSGVSEPPIPVYFVYPNHIDSIKAAYESSQPTNELALIHMMKKYDSLQLQLQKSSAEDTLHFTWLYGLVALLGTMNIVLLFLTVHIKKELFQIKRLEHHQFFTSADTPTESHLPQTQKGLPPKKPTAKISSSQFRKARSKKPRL